MLFSSVDEEVDCDWEGNPCTEKDQGLVGSICPHQDREKSSKEQGHTAEEVACLIFRKMVAKYVHDVHRHTPAVVVEISYRVVRQKSSWWIISVDILA